MKQLSLLRRGLLLLSLLASGGLAAQAQGVTIGAAGAPAPSAVLELKSTTGGLLLPRMTAAQRDAIPSPTNGLLVFQTDGTPGLYYYIGSGWVNLGTGQVPNASGNAGSSPAVRVSTLALIGSQKPDGTGINVTSWDPYGIAGDGAGNVYVTDVLAIRKIVVATGVITTLAGPDVQSSFAVGSGGSFRGNVDGTGTSARFTNLTGLAYDGAGNLYVADAGNNNIRKIVVATGVVSTLAGNGAQFSNPAGLAYDGAGNLYVADAGNNNIRKIVVATGVVSTLAGTGTAGYTNGPVTTAQFRTPDGVACDRSGNVYVAEHYNHCIRKIGRGVVTTLAGGPATGTLGGQLVSDPVSGAADGTGTSARFNMPYDVAYDGAGNLYVTDQGNNRIRQIVVATGVVSTLAGSTAGNADGTGATAQFAIPTHVACDGAGNVYVTDQSLPVIIRVIK
ncbi:MAG: hypothetical protein ACRYFK_03820 [Janthinobacterium lividum]